MISLHYHRIIHIISVVYLLESATAYTHPTVPEPESSPAIRGGQRGVFNSAGRHLQTEVNNEDDTIPLTEEETPLEEETSASGGMLPPTGADGGLLSTQIVQQQLSIQNAVMDQMRNTSVITVTMLGNASPLGNPGPAQTCTAVFVNGQFFLFDVGYGSLASMAASNLPLGEIDAVFLTHYHNDHFADLGEVMEWSWINERPKVLPVFGPTGVQRIVDGYNQVYELDRLYRTAHHGEELMNPDPAPVVAVEFKEPTDEEIRKVVYEKDCLTVSAFRVLHEPIHPAVGYRIEFNGKVIVISGDTIRTEVLLENSRGADLLIAEAMNFQLIQLLETANRQVGEARTAELLFDVRDYHLDTTEAAQLALDAGVHRLALNHLAPVANSDQQRQQFFGQFLADVEAANIETYIGQDGLQITIPAKICPNGTTETAVGDEYLVDTVKTSSAGAQMSFFLLFQPTIYNLAIMSLFLM